MTDIIGIKDIKYLQAVINYSFVFFCSGDYLYKETDFSAYV